MGQNKMYIYLNNVNTMMFCPPLFQATKVKMIRYEDSFFDYFKQKYDDFEEWFFKESTQNRDCWVYYTGNNIGALLIFKVEDEIVPCLSMTLLKKRRLKICTFKVAETILGNKLGELLLKHSVKLTISLGIDEMYLTHFTEKEDKLIQLIQEYGFELTCTKEKNEDIYLKKLFPDESSLNSCSPIEIAKKYYPCFYDGGRVNKFLVPIYPEFHNRLFIDIPDGKTRQTKLPEYQSDLIPENEAKFIVEGNTIQKVYLSHSNNRKMKTGDILLFYKTSPYKCLTAVGVVEKVIFDIKDPEYILNKYKRRTVYDREEIIEFVEKPTSLILFLHVGHFTTFPNLQILSEIGVSAPQSICEINADEYGTIKEIGNISSEFIISDT
jgi:hypothetical protein